MKISLVPVGGLCNRMNSILCAIATQKELNCRIDVYWKKGRELHANFEDLFQPINSSTISIKPLNHVILRQGGRFCNIMNLLRMTKFDKSINGTLNSDNNIREIIGTSKNVYIYASNRFSIYSASNPSNYFIPMQDIQKKIDNVVSRFSYTIGVHIRRTDNILSTKESPLSMFTKKMDEILSDMPSASFFLATDEIDVKSELIKKYGNKIITNDFELSRNSIEGMKNAVVDLWCLANTEYILGSTHSTYTTMASELFSKKLYIL